MACSARSFLQQREEKEGDRRHENAHQQLPREGEMREVDGHEEADQRQAGDTRKAGELVNSEAFSASSAKRPRPSPPRLTR
ncbi:hypothetical protein [Streptomyces sirii]|uniref:hypothetical protein n=1 Tax=Streptomyces sirii TaxID=3127701 RepID=UPI003D3687CC